MPVALSLVGGRWRRRWPRPTARIAPTRLAGVDVASARGAGRAGGLTALAVVLRAAGSLSLRWPARRWVSWALAGFVVSGPVALLAGPYLARPFFGDVGYELVAGAMVPALVFAAANGVMEELMYRGALLAGRPA